MCGYPISSFLFWHIREERKKDWISYDFVRDFDEEFPHNTEANLDGVNQDIYLVLDGQQRITSLNIGLRGTYRFFYRKWKKTKLYLNLLWNRNNENPEDLTYQFLFKEDGAPIPRADYPQFWYRVGDILNFDDAEDAKDAIENQLEHYSEEEQRIAKRIIGRLHSVINVSRIIGLMDICKAEYFRQFVGSKKGCRNIAVLAKRSRALLESNPTRNSQPRYTSGRAVLKRMVLSRFHWVEGGMP